MRYLLDRYRANRPDFWFAFATVAVCALLGWYSHATGGDEAFYAILIAQAMLGTFNWRYGYRGAKEEPRIPFFFWFVPVLVVLVLLPWFLSGALATHDVSIPMSIFLYLLLSVAAVLLSFLLVLFALLPAELLGRAALLALRGHWRDALGFAAIALYLGTITAFGFVGAAALDDLPPGSFGWWPILFALFGIPGHYTVESEAMLWLARGMFVLIVAPMLGFWRLRRDAERADARGTAPTEEPA